jgi:hypothetical protein
MTHPLTVYQIRAVVAAVLDAESERRGKTLDDVVMRAVATILTSFGIDEDDGNELKADFNHLRWRKSVEQAQSYTFKAVITIRPRRRGLDGHQDRTGQIARTRRVS